MQEKRRLDGAWIDGFQKEMMLLLLLSFFRLPQPSARYCWLWFIGQVGLEDLVHMGIVSCLFGKDNFFILFFYPSQAGVPEIL